ncbi:MAG: extracellular solute-binding protein [Clostridia bacterium]|nr:extracellular solute-binding protein [Clostridia bacterium]
MLKLRRFISLALLVSMMCSVSCSNTDDNTKDTSDNSTLTDTDHSTSDTTAKVETAGYYDELSGLDFNDYTFTIATYNSDKNGWNLYLTAEEASGDLISNAAYKRNTEVEEMLNINIEARKVGDYETLFKNAVLADDGEAFDLICFFASGQYGSYITENLVYDWQEVPHLNLDADWYNQSANETFTIAGKQYFGVSDLTFPVQQNASIIFNIDMLEKHNLDSPYDLVREGKWTVDALNSYIKDIYVDANNNDLADENDSYGLVGAVNVFGRIMASSGELEITKSDAGFKLNLFSDNIVNIFDKIRELYNNEATLVAADGNVNINTFKKGNTLFCLYPSDPALLRDIQFDFGYLPFPKADESQEDYITEAIGGMMAIPQSAKNIERTGAIVEALSAGSHKYINEAFIETYIENKVLRSDDAVEMFRLCRDTYTYNFAFNIDPAGLLASHKFYAAILKDTTLELASYYESQREQITTAYDSLWEIAEGND